MPDLDIADFLAAGSVREATNRLLVLAGLLDLDTLSVSKRHALIDVALIELAEISSALCVHQAAKAKGL